MNWHELYQEFILEHNRSPKNFGKIEYTHFSEGYNPLCGDHYHVYINLNNNLIEDISFEGKGCAISKASASMMTDILKGKNVEEAFNLFNKFYKLIEGEQVEGIGNLEILKGVSKYPSRVKCAILAWYAMKSALNNKEIATTE